MSERNQKTAGLIIIEKEIPTCQTLTLKPNLGGACLRQVVLALLSKTVLSVQDFFVVLDYKEFYKCQPK